MKSPRSLLRSVPAAAGEAATAWGARLGAAGLAILVAGMAWTAARFRNPDGSAFNPLRNFVSELGSEKYSRAASVFHGSIIIGSLLMFALVVGLGRRLGGRTGRAAVAAGFLSLLGSVGVGFASMDHLGPHLAAALLYFWGWLATAFLFTVGFWRKCSFRAEPFIILAGLGALLASISFLSVLTRALLGSLGAAFQNPNAFSRPAVWDLAVLEWCVVATLLVWGAAAVPLLRRANRSAAPRRA